MNAAIARGLKLGLSRRHAGILARLETPELIQDFVSAIPNNFETEGPALLSVSEVLRQRRAHCIEAAFLAACALWVHGQPPLLMDMQARGDDDHVLAIFRRGNCWGAISKSNHIWLRWRDPVYRTLRELAMSYFNEYTDGKRRTLRRYSRAYDLRRVDPALWVTRKEDCWDVAEALDDWPHYRLITPAQARHLRRRDNVERRADNTTQYAKPVRRRRRRR